MVNWELPISPCQQIEPSSARRGVDRTSAISGQSSAYRKRERPHRAALGLHKPNTFLLLEIFVAKPVALVYQESSEILYQETSEIPYRETSEIRMRENPEPENGSQPPSLADNAGRQ